MPILSNIEVLYTVGKVSDSTFHPKYVNLRTSVPLSAGVPVLFGCCKCYLKSSRDHY